MLKNILLKCFYGLTFAVTVFNLAAGVQESLFFGRKFLHLCFSRVVHKLSSESYPENREPYK